MGIVLRVHEEVDQPMQKGGMKIVVKLIQQQYSPAVQHLLEQRELGVQQSSPT